MDISGIGSIGSLGNVAGNEPVKRPPPKEHVSAEESKKYLEAMQTIKDFFEKDPDKITQDDISKLREAMQKLDDLDKNGTITVEMRNHKDLVYAFMSSLMIDGKIMMVGDLGKFQDLLKIIKAKFIDLNSTTRISLLDILKITTDIEKRSADTKTIGDMLADLMAQRCEMFESKLKELQAQVDISKKIIDDLNALHEILNKIKINPPEKFPKVFDPENTSQIPTDLLEKVKAVSGKSSPEDIMQWIKDNKNKAYLDLCHDHFVKDPNISLELPSESINQIIKLREDLIKQLEALEKGGAEKDSSQVKAIKEVLDDLNSKFPRDKFPADFEIGEIQPIEETIGTYIIAGLETRDNLMKEIADLKNKKPPNQTLIAEKEKILKGIEDNLKKSLPPGVYSHENFPPFAGKAKYTAKINELNVGIIERNKVNEASNRRINEAKSAVKMWVIEAWDKTGGKTFAKMDNAIQAMSYLSSSLSDKMRMANADFEKLADVLVKVMQELNKIVSGSARRISA